MKQIIITGMALLFITSTYAEKEKHVTSKIKDVTVFLQGAQVHRKGRFSINRGITKIIFEGLTQRFDKNSLQVKGKGEFIILDVSSKIHYPVPEPVKPTTVPEKVLKEISKLNDSIAKMKWKLSEVRDDLNAYNEEKKMLLSSGVIKGQVANDSSIVALKEAMEYMRIKLLATNKTILQLQKKDDDLRKDQTRMQARLNELNNYNASSGHTTPPVQLPVQQVIVTVSADASVSGSLEVGYMIQDAGWTPAYDLRADDISSPVKLTYKANVFQSSGVSWDNVNLTLSTINPNRSNTKPALAPWYVSYYQPIAYREVGKYKSGRYGGDDSDYDLKDNKTESLNEITCSGSTFTYSSNAPQAQHISNYTEMTQNMTMVEFELKIPYTIPSDGKNHLMAVKSENIQSTFEHFIVPKIDNDAFLVAHLTDWEELSLLPAVANIYYDGTYVGQTRVNPSIMSDTMDLALGRDRGIYVTRKKTDDVEKLKAFTNEKIKTVTYEIAVKNYKSSEINLTIEDQIPVSQNENIKVEMIEHSKADYNDKTGNLKWKIDLAAKKTEKYKFTYSLRYDKDKTLALN